MLVRFSENYKRSKGFDEPPVHDPCAVARVIDETIVKAVSAPIHVEYRGDYTAGMTVTDLRGKVPADCHTSVALELDRERFWNLIIEAAKRL